MTSSPASTPAIFNVRSKYFWLISLFVLYSILGFFVVPKIVESQLQTNLKTLANWHTQVEKINFNPYALSLELQGTEISEADNNAVISFERLFINFSLLKSLTGALAFDEISLDQPIINLDVDQSGTTNFQKAFASNAPEEPAVKEEEIAEDSGIMALVFDLIAINSGKIKLSDDSQGENFTLTLEPLSLALENFSTNNNEGGDYALTFSFGNDQEINWQGQIGIAPFQSKGHLELKNIHSSSFWHYAKESSPYWLKQANISLSGRYDTKIAGEVTRLKIEDTELLIEDAILSENADSEAFLNFKNLRLAPISFDLTELALDLGHIELTEPQVFIERAPDASLNILRPLAAEASVETAQDTQDISSESSDKIPSHDPDKQAEASTFNWQIADITMTDGRVKWRDLALASPTEINISDIDIALGTLSDKLSDAFPYTLSFAFENQEVNSGADELANKGGIKQRLSGSLSPQPFAIKGQADISGFKISSLQSYVSESANVVINNGFFSLQSEYDLALHNHLSGTLSSMAVIDGLGVSDSVLNKSLSGLKQLAVGPITVTLPYEQDEPAKVEVEAITLDQPFGDIFIDESGQVNLSHIAKKIDGDVEKAAVTETKPQESEPETEVAATELSLKLFEIKQGKFTYTDASLNPAVVTQLSDLSGTIEGLSSNLEAKSKVAFTGKVDSQGVLDVKGTLNPLSRTPNTDIQIDVNNVNLNVASPYAAKYAGYQIDKGKLDLNLNYLINGSQLKASNQILLNQFEFGKSVDSPDATSLPLPLAIGILKDRNGKIDIDLPISGDLDDPSFKISSVILKTFVNLITKAITSPFSMLSGLIEGGDDISEVQFKANSSELNPEQNSRILALAKALKQRPNLTLEIRGVADTNLDQMHKAVRSEPELIKLAKDRARIMSNIVIEEGGIDADRVFVLEPEIIALKTSETPQKPEPTGAENVPTIASIFTLGVR